MFQNENENVLVRYIDGFGKIQLLLFAFSDS